MDNEDLEKFEGKKVKLSFKTDDPEEQTAPRELTGVLKKVDDETYKIKSETFDIKTIGSVSRGV